MPGLTQLIDKRAQKHTYLRSWGGLKDQMIYTYKALRRVAQSKHSRNLKFLRPKLDITRVLINKQINCGIYIQWNTTQQWQVWEKKLLTCTTTWLDLKIIMLSENTRKSIYIVGFHLPRTLDNANRSTVAESVSVVTGEWQGRGRWEGRITKCQEETVVGGGYVHQADCEHGFVNVHICQKSNCTLKICGICCRSIVS